MALVTHNNMIGFLQRRAGRAFTPTQSKAFPWVLLDLPLNPLGSPSRDGDRLTAAIPSRELLAQGTAGEAEAMYMLHPFSLLNGKQHPKKLRQNMRKS
jgi:hypothetical protein